MKQRQGKEFSKPISILIYLLTCALIGISVISIQSLSLNLWLTMFSTVSICQFSFQYLILRRFGAKAISLSTLFLLFSYLFSFGQIFIMGFFRNYQFTRFNFIEIMDPGSLKATSIFCLATIQMVGFGMLTCSRKYATEIHVAERVNYMKCKMCGWLLVLTTFPIQVYLDLRSMTTSISAGYLATYNLNVSGIWSSFGFLSFTGFALLILGYSAQRRKSITIYILVTAYLCLTMITGNRGHQITVILFLTYLVHRTVYKISWKNFLIFCVVGYLGMGVLNTIANVRGVEGKTISGFTKAFVTSIDQHNPVLDFITEQGGTIYTPYLVMRQIPSDRPYAYGKTYPLAFLTVVPNIGGYFSELNTSASFTKNLQGSALGGSYIGELYYNFSYYGAVFAIFIGVFVNMISQRLTYLVSNKAYFKIGYYAPLFMYILWWPRGTFQDILRPTLWGALALLLVASIWNGSRSNRRMSIPRLRSVDEKTTS